MNIVDVFVGESLSHWLTLHELGGLPEFKMADCEPEVHCIRGMAVDIREITTANRTVSTMTDSLVTLPTLPDVGRLPEFKMADCKPEVHCISGMEGVISEIPTANPTFSTMTPLIGDTAYIARYRQTIGVRNGALLTGSTLHLWNGMIYRLNSNCCLHIFSHFLLTLYTSDKSNVQDRHGV